MPHRRSRSELLRSACTVVGVLNLGAVAALITAHLVEDGGTPVDAAEQQPASVTTAPPAVLEAPATTVVRAERPGPTLPPTTAPPASTTSSTTTSTTQATTTTTRPAPTTTATTATPTTAPPTTAAPRTAEEG